MYMEAVKVAVISIISDKRLIDGGAAIFAADIINHIIDIEGIIMFNPLFIIRFRDLDISYVMLAAANKADLRSPWASIRVSAPFIPHEVLERIPAITRLI